MVSLEQVNDGKNKDRQGSQCQTTSEKMGYMVVSGKFLHRITLLITMKSPLTSVRTGFRMLPRAILRASL